MATSISGQIPAKNNPYFSNKVGGVAFTLAAQAGDVRKVTIQLQSGAVASLGSAGYVRAFLSDAATGLGITATAPSGGVAIGDKGAILATPVANKMWDLQTDAAGAVELDVTEAGAKSFYVVVILPDGTHAVSSALAFA